MGKKKKPKLTLVEKKLQQLYYNYGAEGALQNNVNRLLELVRQQGHPKATRQQVQTFLSKQPSYTVHRRIQTRQFPHRKIRIPVSNARIDGDLIELQDLASWNDGHRYILVCIDAFSRYVWAAPLKNKEAQTTAKALQQMMEDDDTFHTMLLYTDGGKEFTGMPFQVVLKKHGWKHRICTSEDFHCPFVERVIRTLKEKLFQAMTSQHSRRWLDLLPKIVQTYNHTPHSATGLTPDASRLPENHLQVVQRVVPMPPLSPTPLPIYRYKKGDLVRIAKVRAAFDKGYLPRFTWEIFRIHKRANDRPHDKYAVPAYILEDLQGEIIEHAVFYEPELVRVHKDQLKESTPIREILAEKGDQVKVWFQGFAKKDAMWIPRSKLV